MRFYAPNLSDISLMAVLRPDAIGAVARFWLVRVTAGGNQLLGDSIVMHSGNTFTIPSATLAVWGANEGLRLDVQPAFNGATTADVLVTLSQGGANLPNLDAPPVGKSSDYLFTVTDNGVIAPSPNFFISF